MSSADAAAAFALGHAAVGPRGYARTSRSAAGGDGAALTVDLDRARGGDEAAFARLYRAVQPGLLRYLSVLVGAEAEDMASETWSQVCRDLPGFRGDVDGFRGWVATIGRHRALDHCRARGRRPMASIPVESLVTRAGADDTEQLALESLSTAAALALIGTLPPDQAEAVLLRSVLGLDAKTAGVVLGKRPGAVRTACHRGLQSLALRTGAVEEASKLTRM